MPRPTGGAGRGGPGCGAGRVVASRRWALRGFSRTIFPAGNGRARGHSPFPQPHTCMNGQQIRIVPQSVADMRAVGRTASLGTHDVLLASCRWGRACSAARWASAAVCTASALRQPVTTRRVYRQFADELRRDRGGAARPGGVPPGPGRHAGAATNGDGNKAAAAGGADVVVRARSISGRTARSPVHGRAGRSRPHAGSVVTPGAFVSPPGTGR